MKIYKCLCCNELIGEKALIVSETLQIKTCPKCGSDNIEEVK